MAQVNIELKIGGSIVDSATAEMTDAALGFAIEAVCDACNYDPDMLDADGQPVSRPRFFSWMMRKWVEKQTERYAVKLATAAAVTQAKELTGTVVVPD